FRLSPDQDPLRAGAADPGLHSGPDAGGELPPLADRLARQLGGVSGATDLRRLSRGQPAVPARCAAARYSPGPGESIPRNVISLVATRVSRLPLCRRRYAFGMTSGEDGTPRA